MKGPAIETAAHTGNRNADPMKPRIVRIKLTWLGATWEAWHCSNAYCYGVGVSPIDAFETWQKQDGVRVRS